MLNLQIFSTMTTIYKYYIRYYRITKKGRKCPYYVIESPAYAFEDICSESMRNTIRNIASNSQYNIDSYHVDAVLIDSLSGCNVLTEPDLSDLPF